MPLCPSADTLAAYFAPPCWCNIYYIFNINILYINIVQYAEKSSSDTSSFDFAAGLLSVKVVICSRIVLSVWHGGPVT